jgi:hypothetical protein
VHWCNGSGSFRKKRRRLQQSLSFVVRQWSARCCQSASSHRRSAKINHELRSGYIGLQYDESSTQIKHPQLTLIVHSFTKIPVPKVLDWSDDDSSIGTEYIIMEHAAGVQMHGKWPSMSSSSTHVVRKERKSYDGGNGKASISSVRKSILCGRTHRAEPEVRFR